MVKVDQDTSGGCTLYLEEMFDFKQVENFRNAYESIDASTCKNIYLDFKETRYMDSSALGMMLNLKNYFKDDNISLRIIHVNEQIRKIFAISRFDQRFQID